MALNDKKNLKIYYSIGEVAKMLNVNESLLRYWEKEFPAITPRKTNGIRQYQEEDIRKIRMVYHLLREKGMKISAARRQLAQNTETVQTNTELMERLKKIREELVSMRKELDYLT